MEFYHTYNRGVEKRKIFLDNLDYLRGAHDLYEFNNINSVVNLDRRFEGFTKSLKSPEGAEKEMREILVSMGAWCFMPNHYHFFSSPIKDGSLALFHRKIGVGLANFFNTKYERSGALFQGRYKKVLVENDTQALQLICYIHSNPLDLWKHKWKEKGLTDPEIKTALKFLENYRWSGHMDWWGIKNFPSIIDYEFMHRFFEDPKEYKDFFINWLKYYEKNTHDIKKMFIE
ncbi:MAG: transposase [Candidatus Nealsonbacteria bacterium]|nr:transposase [Candidatus Nealsonbacteria bacterium]